MLLAAGHDCVPVMFAVDGANRISQGVKLEETKRQEAATPTNTAMRMFQNKDRTGNELLDSSLPTTHQNQVETNLKRSKCRSRHMNNIGKRTKY